MEFNGYLGMVVRGYLLGGGGFIKVICRWQNWSVNPPLQVFFNG